MTSARATENQPLPLEVRGALHRLRRRGRLARALEGLCVTLATGSLLFLLSIALDRFLILSHAVRMAATLAAGGATLAVVLWFLMGPLLRPLSRRALALEIEAGCSELAGALLSVVELADGDERDRRRCSPELLELLRQRTARRMEAFEVERLVDLRAVRHSALWAGAGILALSAFAGLDPGGFLDLARRFLSPGLDLRRPTSVVLDVAPGNAIVRRGESRELKIVAVRGSPRRVTLYQRTGDHPVGAEVGEWNAAVLKRHASTDGGPPAFRHLLAGIHRPLLYRVRGGDFESPVYRIEPRDPPRPTAFRMTYRPPAYTGKAPRTVESRRGDLTARKGSAADLRVTVDSKLERAWLHVDGEARREVDCNGDLVEIRDLAMSRNGSYRLELESADGISNDARAEYFIRVEPDAPPRVGILAPRLAEIRVESRSHLEVHYRAEDDVGLAGIELEVSSGSEPEKAVRLFQRRAGAQAPLLVEDSWTLDVASLSLRPGETRSLTLKARDTLGQEARSMPLALRVGYLAESPEGAAWLGRLRDLGKTLSELRAGWEKLLPGARGELGPLPPDPEPPASPSDTAQGMASLRALAERAGDAAFELARSIGPPSPNRQALEAVALRLESFASDDAARFWKLAMAPSGERRALPRGEAPERGPPAEAADGGAEYREAHERAARRLGSLEEDFDSLRMAERLEEDRERLRLIAGDVDLLAEAASRRGAGAATDKLGAAQGSLSVRITSLVEETIQVYADLLLIGEAEPKESSLAPLARALETSVIEALEDARNAVDEGDRERVRRGLERAREALEGRLPSVANEHERARGQAAAARARLELPIDVPGRIETIEGMLRARAQEEDRATSGGFETAVLEEARRAFREIGFLVRRSEAFSYGDFESTAVLAAVLDLLDRTLRKTVGGAQRTAGGTTRANAPGGSEAAALLARAEFLEELAAAWRKTEPLLALGRRIQNLEWIAEGEEALAWKLRTARVWNPRRVGLLARTQREILEALRETLVEHGEAGSGGELSSIASRVWLAVEKADRGRAAMEKCMEALENPPDSSGAGSESGVPALALAEARRAARLIDEASAELEALRASALPEARSAAKWLQETRGSVAARIALLADAEKDHAGRLRMIAGAIDAVGLAALCLEQERHQRQALSLASELQREWVELSRREPESQRFRAVEQGARGVLSAARGPMLEASRALQRARGDGNPNREDLEEASRKEERAAEELRAVAGALLILEDEELERLTSDRLSSIREDAALLGEQEHADPRQIAEKALLLLEASQKGARVLAERLPAGPLKDDLLDHLGEAALQFAKSLELARSGDAVEARDALRSGLARFQLAIDIARRIRGDAVDALARGEEVREGAAGDERGERSKELEETRKELAKLLEARSAQKDVEALLSELLEEGDPIQETLRRVLDAHSELERAMDEDFLSNEDLLELVATLATVERRGKELSETERYMEERARGAAARGRRIGSADIDEQRGLLGLARSMVGDFEATGSRITAMLPDVWRAFRKTSSLGATLIEAMVEIESEMEAGDLRAAVDALSRANLELGLFLAGVSQTRRRALEAIAGAESGSVRTGGSQAAVERASRALRNASRLMAQGDLQSALEAHRSAGRSLGRAAMALRRQLASAALSAGVEAELLSSVLERRTAGEATWDVETRGEAFEEATVANWKSRADMPYPDGYSELVRMYLELLRLEAQAITAPEESP